MSTPPRDERWLSEAAAPVLLAGVVYVLAVTVWRVAQRLGFGFDLLYWPDDYFMTLVMKLDAGEPLYSAPADTNSWIYAPGGPLLHYVLLKPFGAARDFLAHKLLSQLWLWAAIGLAGALGWALIRSEDQLPQRRLQRFELAAILVGCLALAAYTNPIADSLHPTNLELCAIAGTAYVSARWPGLGRRTRLALLLLLPSAALMFKQTGGVAVTATLSLVALSTPGRLQLRLALAALPGIAAGLTLLALVLTTQGEFWTWAYTIPQSAKWEMWKTGDMERGLGLLLYPQLALIVARSAFALWRRSAADWTWLRALLVAVFYTPLAIVALFKALGGPNNLLLLNFVYAMFALPVLASRIFVGFTALRLASANGVALCAFALWLPHKRVPTAADFEHAETLCNFFVARTSCGEKVLLPRGAVCYERAGIPFPRDRAMSAMDLTAAGRGTGMAERLSTEFYDVVLVTDADIHMPWLSPSLLMPLGKHYQAFAQIPPGQSGAAGDGSGALWLEGWGNFMAGPVTAFERRKQAGTHRVDAAAFARCPAPAR